jgi:hypothetical protein
MGNKHTKSTNVLNNMDNNNNQSTKFSLKRRLTNSKYASSSNMNKSTSTMNLNRSSTSPVIAKWRFSTVLTNDENTSPHQTNLVQQRPTTNVNKLKPIQLDSSPMSNLKSSNNRVLDLNRQLKSNQQNLTNAIKTINQQHQSPYHVNSKLYKPNSSLLMATTTTTTATPNVTNHQKQPQHQHELLNKNMYPSSNFSNKSLQQMNQKSLQQHQQQTPQKNVCKIQSNNFNNIENSSSLDVNCCESSSNNNNNTEKITNNNNNRLKKAKSKSNFSLTAAKFIGNLSPKIKRKLLETFTCHSTSVNNNNNNNNNDNNHIKYNTIGRSTLNSTFNNDIDNFKQLNSSLRIKSKSSNNILNVNSRSNKNNVNKKVIGKLCFKNHLK